MEYELDAPTIIQWGSESESFLRYRYKAIRRQIGLVPDEVDRPKNDAILAAAVCAAKLSRKKLRPDGHPISSLHAENTDPPSSALGSTRGNAKPPTVPVSAQKGREYSRFPGSYFDDILRYFNLFEQRSAQKPPETQDDWISLFSSVTKKIDANDPCVTSVDLSRYKVRQILERNSSAEVQEQRNSLLPAERKEVDPDNPDTAILGSLVDMKIANKPHVIDEQYAEELLAKILALPAPPPGKKGDEHWIHCSEVAKILDIKTASLGRYRSQNSLASYVVKHGNPDAEDDDSRIVLAGVEKYGRAWRKLSAGAQVHYYRPSVGLDKKTADSKAVGSGETIDSDAMTSDETIDLHPSGT